MRGLSLDSPTEIGFRNTSNPMAMSRGGAEAMSRACVKEVWWIACTSYSLYALELLLYLVKVCQFISAYHDPKGEVDGKKGPRSKYKQKTSVEPLSVTWVYRDSGPNESRTSCRSCRQGLCTAAAVTCWYIDILVDCSRDEEETRCLESPRCQCECGYFW